MQLTQYTDYSLRVLIYLTRFGGDGATIAEIAEYFHISRNHLMKVVNGLSSAGFIVTTRGKGGGMELARPANTIMVGEVVRATESDFHLAECFDLGHDQCVITRCCALKSVLHVARRDFFKVLDRYSIAEAAGARLPPLEFSSPGGFGTTTEEVLPSR